MKNGPAGKYLVREHERPIHAHEVGQEGQRFDLAVLEVCMHALQHLWHVRQIWLCSCSTHKKIYDMCGRIMHAPVDWHQPSPGPWFVTTSTAVDTAIPCGMILRQHLAL